MPPSRAAGRGRGCPSSGCAGSGLVCLGRRLEWESCGQDKRREGSGAGAAGPRAGTQPCGVQAGRQTRGAQRHPTLPKPHTPPPFPQPAPAPTHVSPSQLPGPALTPPAAACGFIATGGGPCDGGTEEVVTDDCVSHGCHHRARHPHRRGASTLAVVRLGELRLRECRGCGSSSLTTALNPTYSQNSVLPCSGFSLIPAPVRGRSQHIHIPAGRLSALPRRSPGAPAKPPPAFNPPKFRMGPSHGGDVGLGLHLAGCRGAGMGWCRRRGH